MNIAFVHFKSVFPAHLMKNLATTRKLFPDLNIYLIHDRKKKIGIKGIREQILLPIKEESDLEEVYGYPRDFRNNFWFSSLVRFSAIKRFMSEVDHPLLHIESDVIISEDFPYRKLESEVQHLAFSVVSKRRAIASLVYFNCYKDALNLWNFASNQVRIDPLLSDMQLLFRYLKSYPNKVEALPIAPDLLHKKDLLSQKEKTNAQKSYNKYLGFFDGHDFGVYLAGTNPWNAAGISKLHQRIDESLLEFDGTNLKFNTKRNFVDLKTSDGNTSPLYSLHITNKNFILFTNIGRSWGLRMLTLFPLKRFSKTFHPFVFFIMCCKFILKRTKIIWRNLR